MDLQHQPRAARQIEKGYFPQPIRAAVLLSYGNSSQPGSPHRTDQLPYFAQKRLRPVWLTREEVMQHLTARDVF